MALINFPNFGAGNIGNSGSSPMTTPTTFNPFKPTTPPASSLMSPQNYKGYLSVMGDANSTNPTTSVANSINSVGVKANNPNQNITPASKTLTPAQKAPAAPKTLNTSGLLQALARQKAANGVVGQNGYNEADKGNLAYAKNNGWVAPTATPASPAITPPAKNTQGLTADQMKQYANGQIDINGNPITNASSVGKLVNSAVSAPAVAAPAITGLTGTAATNPGNSGPANDAYKATLQKIQDLQANYAAETSQITNGGGDVNWGEGQRGALDQAFNIQIQGLQNLAAAQANALGYQISGVQTQQTGYNEAGGLAQNAQGQTQSGLTAAAGLSLPQQVPYGTPLVNPQTGQNINMTAGGVDPSDPFYKTMQSYAQLMVNNQGSAIPTSITGNSVLNAQLIKMAQQINPNFNVNVAAGAGSAQGGSAASQYSQVESWKSSLQQGQNLQSQFTDLMNTYGLNPSDINKFNTGIQSIANNTSDPRYKMFNNYIADIANTYAQILTPAGGNVSDYKTQIANSMLDASMKGTGLVDVMKGLDQQAQAKIAGVSTGGGLGGNSGGSNSASINGTNFSFVNGQWVVNQ